MREVAKAILKCHPATLYRELGKIAPLPSADGEGVSSSAEGISERKPMHCYVNLVSSHKTILDEEGIEVADINEARAFAREAIAEMVQDGVAEFAHWRGWEIETRDASGAVLFTIGFDALLPPEARGAVVQAVVAVSSEEDSTYAYGKAA